MNLRATTRVASREVRGMFESPGGYVVLGTFWLVAGLLLVSLLFRYREAGIQLAQSGQLRTGAVGLHINDYVIRPLLYNLGSVLIFFVPLLTMKTLAEERRTGSLELMLSQPLRGGELVLGKYLGALGALGLCLAVLLVHGLVLGLVSRPDWGATLGGLLGLLLLGSFFTSIGVLLSVLSRSQVEAAVLSLGTLLAFVIGPDALTPSKGGESSVLQFFSVLGRFEDFTRGVLDLGHVAFFVGATLVVLAAALRALDLVRWQG
jgi:ABC-2 type transport system permease protein